MKRRLRWILMAVCAAGMLHALVRATAGALPTWQTISIVVLGLVVLLRLPHGGRASGWLFSVWCAVALICLGNSALEGVEDKAERLRVGLMGAGAFLSLSILALHACTPTGTQRTNRKTTQ